MEESAHEIGWIGNRDKRRALEELGASVSPPTLPFGAGRLISSPASSSARFVSARQTADLYERDNPPAQPPLIKQVELRGCRTSAAGHRRLGAIIDELHATSAMATTGNASHMLRAEEEDKAQSNSYKLLDGVIKQLSAQSQSVVDQPRELRRVLLARYLVIGWTEPISALEAAAGHLEATSRSRPLELLLEAGAALEEEHALPFTRRDMLNGVAGSAEGLYPRAFANPHVHAARYAQMEYLECIATGLPALDVGLLNRSHVEYAAEEGKPEDEQLGMRALERLRNMVQAQFNATDWDGPVLELRGAEENGAAYEGAAPLFSSLLRRLVPQCSGFASRDRLSRDACALRRRLYDDVHTEARSETETTSGYVDRALAAAAKNPMLRVVATRLDSLTAGWTHAPASWKDSSEARGARARDVRRAVVYSYLLDLLTRRLADEARGGVTQLAQFHRAFAALTRASATSSTSSWKWHLSSFERAKMASIQVVVDQFVRDKATPRPSLGHAPQEHIMGKSGFGLWWLSVNVLEAMTQDAGGGAAANAQAGASLFAEPPSKGEPIAPLQTLHSYLDDEWARYHHFPPYPRVWSNLYVSWNGAFVSDYPDAPMHLAKLFGPTVAGAYNDADDADDGAQQRGTDRRGLLLYYRTISLWLHLHFVAFSRAATLGDWLTQADWRAPALQLTWGQLNEAFARRYDRRVLHGYEAAAKAARAASAADPLGASITLQRSRRQQLLAAWEPIRRLARTWPDQRGWGSLARLLDRAQASVFGAPDLLSHAARIRSMLLDAAAIPANASHALPLHRG